MWKVDKVSPNLEDLSSRILNIELEVLIPDRISCSETSGSHSKKDAIILWLLNLSFQQKDMIELQLQDQRKMKILSVQEFQHEIQCRKFSLPHGQEKK
jgi:hypothetical protein